MKFLQFFLAQFYSVNLREVGGQAWPYKSTKVKSVVSVVFGDGKPEDEQLRHWRYWHGRQHTAKQRVIDIGESPYKNFQKICQKNFQKISKKFSNFCS